MQPVAAAGISQPIRTAPTGRNPKAAATTSTSTSTPPRPRVYRRPRPLTARAAVGMLGPVWAVLGVLGIAVVGTGWLPADDARRIAVDRAGPILGFLVAVTILAELADRAGVFDAAAAWCARAARGSTAALFLLIALLATLVTVGMSLDTTAVLLTPVVLAVADRLRLPALPFAMLVVWLANTASLLLPVSNLTNLLALQHTGMSTVDFARHLALPELAAVGVTVGYLGLLHRRDLSGRYACPERTAPADRTTFRLCAAACVLFAVAVTLGVPPWLAATSAAVAVVAVFAVRDRGALRWGLFPWRLLVTTEGLFLLVAALTRHGMGDLLARCAGQSPLRTTAVAAAASNAVNNLPAYLAMEHAVPQESHLRLFAVLLGTNAGPLVTMWGSVATLLWAERCRARGLRIAPLRFAAVGAAGVPLVLLAASAALAR